MRPASAVPSAITAFFCPASLQSYALLSGLFAPLKTVVDAEGGCDKLHGFFQYPALVKSLAYTLLDLFLKKAVTTMDVHGLPHAH